MTIAEHRISICIWKGDYNVNLWFDKLYTPKRCLYQMTFNIRENFIRLMLISGLDYTYEPSKRKLHVYLYSTADIDRYMFINTQIYSFIYENIDYDRKKVEEFFSNG